MPPLEEPRPVRLGRVDHAGCRVGDDPPPPDRIAHGRRVAATVSRIGLAAHQLRHAESRYIRWREDQGKARFVIDALSRLSCARSLNLPKYSTSLSGRMPRGAGTHSRGVVGICRLSRRNAHPEKRLRRGQKSPAMVVSDSSGRTMAYNEELRLGTA